MKSYRLQFSTFPLILLVVVFALSCSVARDAAKSTDQENIQGVWLAQTESLNGIKKDVIYQYICEGNKFTFIDENGKEMKYSFKLDNNSTPKLIILQTVNMDNDTTSVGVGYELKGDSLKIVVAPPKMRPIDISDKHDQELIICKRKGS